ncbi:MAG: cytochrome c biogenesis protein CcdA [Acidobacteriota bacterium]|nr:cytochrome c biogenesis protein CcdA [Acidobacteriota bacterium]MDE3043745.1 cytochrome c biogenesis protein CcdA [Acidobacteriota bacterium]MDE3107859.1 cytochrome c biogenesis protein CcdA [Acidobacteriota bacterium]MDE3222161.1 cytochrome c biogenesis protein CcdA [Acidobacteriota bacterium]
MIAALPSSLIASIPLAIAAGFVSFISPCVLPLLPGYLAFLSGATGRGGRGRAVAGALAFILGFALVFVSFGALFGGLGAQLQTHQRVLEVIFGIVTIGLGLFFAGWWPSSWLQRERRVHRLPRASVLGAAMLGFTFALGWTPCIGPTLAAILGLAASSSGATAVRGSILAFFYCLGLGVPFVVAALATEWMASASSWLRRHARAIGRVGGVLLIVIGLLEVTGAWHHFVLWLQIHFPSSSSVL